MQSSGTTMRVECVPNPARGFRGAPWFGLLLAGVLAGMFDVWAKPTGGAGGTNGPVRGVSPRFKVHQYVLLGPSTLSPERVQEVMSGAVGSEVTSEQMRDGLRRLQRLLEEEGLAGVTLSLARQPITNGVVGIRVQTAAMPTTSRDTFEVRSFEVRGNQTLTSSEVQESLAPAIGSAVTVAEIRAALARLQAVYRERGLVDATVTLPEQAPAQGKVRIEVSEGVPLRVALPTFDANASLAAGTPKTPVFEVRRYDVSGNSLLRPEVVDQILTNATGAEVTLTQIRKALGELQLAYRERGYATVTVGLPQQQLTNAVVKVQVIEGELVDIRVTGNRHFSSNNVTRALPSLATNQVLNSRVFQSELDIANQNRDRQIYPVVGPGPEPGTSSLNLKVKDRLPIHGRLEVNNYNTPATPSWRINTSAQYNNLWQLEHQVGLSYGFSPQEYKNPIPQPDLLLNRPLIANFGGYYRMPFGPPEALSSRLNSSTRFGYDEATREFRLPPADGQSEATVYGSASSNDTGVQYGPPLIVTDKPGLKIVSQDTGRNLTDNAAIGGRFSFPKIVGQTHRLAFSAGPDLKYFSTESYNTNNFFFTQTYTTPQGGVITTNWVESSPQPVRNNDVHYLPLSVGVDYSHKDRTGTMSANVGVSYNFVGNAAEFRALALSPSAKADWAKFVASANRDQKLWGNWNLWLRASAQAATGPLINNEQFALGGMNSVRGYFEGDENGDAGWFGSAELRTPYLVENVPIWKDQAPVWVRALIFMDVGQRFIYQAPSFLEQFNTLWGTGFGLSANINNHVDVRITVGWPLLNSINTDEGTARTYFSLGGQF